jgi:hypothetical protein
MKILPILPALLIIILGFTGCNKEDDKGNEGATDSISLRYVDLNPGTTFINPFSIDSVKISVEQWTEYNGPHPYTNERVWILSTNPAKVMLSFGRISNYQLYSLDKDSLIDESLEWHDSYVSGGYIQAPVGYRSNYVGLKITENGKTHFGWIHTPTCYMMTEYAIDTSSSSGKKIYAGRLKK